MDFLLALAVKCCNNCTAEEFGELGEGSTYVRAKSWEKVIKNVSDNNGTWIRSKALKLARITEKEEFASSLLSSITSKSESEKAKFQIQMKSQSELYGR
jgi:hypothetical protein